MYKRQAQRRSEEWTWVLTFAQRAPAASQKQPLTACLWWGWGNPAPFSRIEGSRRPWNTKWRPPALLLIRNHWLGTLLPALRLTIQTLPPLISHPPEIAMLRLYNQGGLQAADCASETKWRSQFVGWSWYLSLVTNAPWLQTQGFREPRSKAFGGVFRHYKAGFTYRYISV